MLTPVKTVVIMGATPASMVYLHALVAKGQGDHYNYKAGLIRVNIMHVDTVKEKTLAGVDSVTLEYQR